MLGAYSITPWPLRTPWYTLQILTRELGLELAKGHFLDREFRQRAGKRLGQKVRFAIERQLAVIEQDRGGVKR